jgi:hypothetical protein
MSNSMPLPFVTCSAHLSDGALADFQIKLNTPATGVALARPYGATPAPLWQTERRRLICLCKVECREETYSYGNSFISSA